MPVVGQFDTPLTPSEEVQFQAWKAQYAPRDSGADYDLRGAFKAGLRPDPQTGHWPDTFKKPNHPTFSNESRYATGANASKAGYWTGPDHDQFVPPSSTPTQQVAPRAVSALPESAAVPASPRPSSVGYSRVQLLEALRTDHPEFRAIDDNKLFAALAIDHPDIAKGISELQAPTNSIPASDNRTATEVMQDQAAAVLKGIPQAITAIPGAVRSAASKLATSPTPEIAAVRQGIETARGIARPLVTIAKGAASLIAEPEFPARNFPEGDPSNPAWNQAAEFAGMNLGANLLGAGIEKAAPAIKSAVQSSDLPRQLLQRAEDIRARPGVKPPTTVPLSKFAAANTAIRTIAARRPIATAYEAVGNALAGENRLPLTRAEVAADEASRMARVQMDQPPVEVPNAEPLNIPRPGAPQFIQDALDRMRAEETPEQLYARQQTQRETADYSKAPLTEVPPGGTPRPQSPDLTAERLRMWNELGKSESGIAELPPDAPSVNKWMGIRPDEVAHGADPGARVLSENLLGPTKEATKANVDAALTDASQQMQVHLKAATQAGKVIDAQTPVYDAWSQAVSKLNAPAESTFTRNIQEVVDKIESRYPNLDKLSPEQTHQLKVEIGDAVNWKVSDDPFNQMLKQMYRDLNSAIKTEIPDIAPVQSRWGDLYISSKGLKSGMAKDIVGKGTGPTPKPGLAETAKQTMERRAAESRSAAPGEATAPAQPDLATMHSEIDALHNHPARTDPASPEAPRFLFDLRNAARRYDPDTTAFVDRAENARKAGNTSLYAQQSEVALMRLHSAYSRALTEKIGLPGTGAPPQASPVTRSQLGSALAGEPRGVTQMVDAYLSQFRDIARSGVTETTGKAMGNNPEMPSANYGTESIRHGGGIMDSFPELRSIDATPKQIADAIDRKVKNPSASNVLYDRVRKAVAAEMQGQREWRPETGPEPLFQQFLRKRRSASEEPPF